MSNGDVSLVHSRGVPTADAACSDIIALSQVVTAWAPREILAIGHAVSQDVRAALESSSRQNGRITWTDNAAGIEPARYDLVWAHDCFALADDANAEYALRQIHGGLAEGGRLVVPLGPDVGDPNPDTDLFDRWFRFHRTGPDLARLALAAGFAEDGIVVHQDPASGDLTLIASKTTPG